MEIRVQKKHLFIIIRIAYFVLRLVFWKKGNLQLRVWLKRMKALKIKMRKMGVRLKHLGIWLKKLRYRTAGISRFVYMFLFCRVSFINMLYIIWLNGWPTYLWHIKLFTDSYILDAGTKKHLTTIIFCVKLW